MTKFASVHEDFKKLYMERKKLAHTHCTIVKREFNKLQQRRSWMARCLWLRKPTWILNKSAAGGSSKTGKSWRTWSYF